MKTFFKEIVSVYGFLVCDDTRDWYNNCYLLQEKSVNLTNF